LGLLLLVSIESSEAALNNLGQSPLMGWTSWDLCAIKNHPQYGGGWLNSTNLMQQSDAMKRKLQSFGYNYLNIDSFWANDGNHEVDEYGRYSVNTVRFPHGIQQVIDHVHRNGQKIGLYINPGIPKAAVHRNTRVKGTSCHAKDIVMMPLRYGNVFQNAYMLNYNHPCAYDFIKSWAELFAEWEIDFLKIDAVSPGSWNNTLDCMPDIKAWATALNETGREIWLELSWSLDVKYIDFWKKYSNGWRVDDDVDCYCNTLVTWVSVSRRFTDVLPFIAHAGPGGWNDLDSVVIGNEPSLSGLTNVERQTVATLWAISCAQFYMGGDVTKFDSYGLSLLTNKEVIAINQHGVPARPLPNSVKKPTQVWYAKNKDKTVTVALFNLENRAVRMTVDFKEFGLSGEASVRDVWQRKDIGKLRHITESVHPHGSLLYKLTPL